MTDHIDLSAQTAYVPTTKNGAPRMVHLPPELVASLANHPRGLARPGKVFRFTKSGRLYSFLDSDKKRAGRDLAFVTFHIFRHTWATWMRRYGGANTAGLVATGAWKDRASAARYEHTVVSEESRSADLLPTPRSKNAG